jgi:CheY-like chemotaxis protein
MISLMMEKIVKILLIEDEERNQNQVRGILNQKGILHKLKVVENGEEGLKFLKLAKSTEFDGSPDVILLDFDILKVNGFEFLREFRKMKNQRAPKIFVLADSDEQRKQCTGMGVSGYIEKPIVSNRLSNDAILLVIDLMNFD